MAFVDDYYGAKTATANDDFNIAKTVTDAANNNTEVIAYDVAAILLNAIEATALGRHIPTTATITWQIRIYTIVTAFRWTPKSMRTMIMLRL